MGCLILSSHGVREMGKNAFRLGLAFLATVVSLYAEDTVETLSSEPAESSSSAPSPYLLSPFDTVGIAVYGQPDLAIEQRISDTGFVSMPLLGNIEIGGLTVQQAQSKVRRALIEEELLREPMVTLAIEEFSPKQVTLLGQVNQPGSVILPSGANYIAIESAIAMAGGFTGTARRTRVRVTRYDSDAERERVFRVNIDEILEDRDGEFSITSFRVYPGDIIFVPQRLF